MMRTSWGCRLLVLTVLAVGTLNAGIVAAQESGSDATVQELQQSQQEMQKEMAEIKTELQAVRKDLKQVLSELRSLRTAQARQKPQQRKEDTTVYNIDIGNSPIRGPKDAPVTIVEYASFACGWCVREVPTVNKVMEAYPGKVRWVLKHYPMWDKAKPAHAAAELARQEKGEDGFWQMHDLIIANPKGLAVADLRKHAESMGLDLAKFDAVMADSDQVAKLAMVDTPGASQYKVTGTPAVFVNGLKLSPRTFDGYKARIDAILAGKGNAGAEEKEAG